MTKKRRPLLKNGRKLAVLRPKDAGLAIALLKEWEKASPEMEPERRQQAFDEILNAQEYTIVGLAEHAQHKSPEVGIIDLKGNRVGILSMGDSVIDYEEFVKAQGSGT